ncbi:hypothetical protein GPL15_09270 [Clostridium sp. MCC353]|uniref:AIPR family protein n=1 Tax=Clostridium sp. MCC353 TaxID=2592646 RepID=UPI001C038D20|nr:AIPR family protein [Clostridium sp. MCC353]MBT9776690.1 hypothetical protein [Clostridium sp. MCC353]
MSVIRMKTKKIEAYGEYIRNILINRDIDCDEQWWEGLESSSEIESLINTETYKISNSLKMKIESEEKFIFLGFKQCVDRERLLKEIGDEVKHMADGYDGGLGSIHLVCFVTNMRNRIFLEKLICSEEGQKMKRRVRTITGNKRDRINCTYILDHEFKKQDIKLVNLKRYELIQMPAPRSHINWEGNETFKAGRKGYVMTVDLYQLVEIYNKVGDRLFDRNVRYGLNEQLGVDQAIKDTLENNPEQFWFKNNGVTIMVEWRDFKLDRVGEILLESLNEYGNLQFSVINGAQTITAAAEYFYGQEYELEECRLEAEKKKIRDRINGSKGAQVLLRIIHIPREEEGGAQDGSSKEVSEISVALNRQKPIKSEDIAFASPFVEKMAGYLEREQRAGRKYFKLVKRGEDSRFEHSIDLVEFARAQKACAGEPGDARSKGTNTLLSFESGLNADYHFKDTGIFAEEWMNADPSEEPLVFQKYYGAVSFAVKTSRLYEKLRPDFYFPDFKQQVVIQNGKWYFTSYLTGLFNSFHTDFLEFQDRFDLVNLCMTELMELFAKRVAELSGDYLEDEYEFNSNLFKKNEFFNYIVNEMDWTEFGDLVNDLPESGGNLLFTGPEDQSANRILALKVNRIELGTGEDEQDISVDSTAEAMVKTTEYILTNYHYTNAEIIAWCGGWLGDDRAEIDFTAGYFRGREKKIMVNGKEYWIGTSSNSKRKYDQIEELCMVVGVKHGTIRWYSKSVKKPIFEW